MRRPGNCRRLGGGVQDGFLEMGIFHCLSSGTQGELPEVGLAVESGSILV